MKVLVCGGRDYKKRSLVWKTLDELNEEVGITRLIEGGANGADGFASDWAHENSITRVTVFANWDRDGKLAGPIRNSKMLAEETPELVVAFPGGAGTADMIKKAKAKGIRVIETGKP